MANNTLRVGLLGFEQDGARVIAQTPDGKTLKVRCGCAAIFLKGREGVLKSRRPGRMLHCYECSCKARARGAEEAAPKRNRFKGQFAAHQGV